MSEIPHGWSVAPLSTVTNVIRGVTYTKSVARMSPGDGYLPILRATNINGSLSLDSEMVYVPQRYVSDSQRLQVGDIIVATSSGSANVVGKSAQLKEPWEGGFGAFCAAVRPSRHMAPGYIAHFVASPFVRRTWREQALGTNINNLKLSDVEGTDVLVPPLREQERIVAAIEEEFSRLDAGILALNRVQRNLDRMQVSVLKTTVSGQSYRETGQPESESLPTGWSWRPLDEIILRLRNGVFVSRPGTEPIGIPIYRISAVRPMTLNVEDVRYVPPSTELAHVDDFLVKPGDLLFTRYSGNPEYVGACAMVPQSGAGVLHPDKLIRVQVNRTIVEPRYIELAAATGRTRREIRKRIKTTAGQTGIAGSDLKSVPFPVPPIDIQRQIIEQVDIALAGIVRTESSLGVLRKDADALRSSILASAFSGKLVPQDASDEPASGLLERIADERASSPKASRSRKPRTPSRQKAKS